VEQLAPAIVFLANDASAFVTGSVLVADGGLHHLLTLSAVMARRRAYAASACRQMSTTGRKGGHPRGDPSCPLLLDRAVRPPFPSGTPANVTPTDTATQPSPGSRRARPKGFEPLTF
jgi:hypothetical protein